MSRLVVSDLFPQHAELLSLTSDELFEEADLAFWLRDELESDPGGAAMVVRADLPEDDSVAMSLLTATPPSARECFPTSISTLRTAVQRVLDSAQRPRAFVWREGELAQLDDSKFVRPGDQVVVDDGHNLLLRGVVVEEPPREPERIDAVWGECDVRVVLPGGESDDLLVALAGLGPDEAQEAYVALTGDAGTQLVLPPALDPEDGSLPWLVLHSALSVASDPEARQEWSPRTTGRVTLADHQKEVGQRAEGFGTQLGLRDDVVNALRLAGEHHDEGKDDPDFQDVLWGPVPTRERDVVLAKSVSHSSQQPQRRRGSVTWRHEQLSAARAWAHLPPGRVRDLAVRLVGTSHGRGRPFFPHGASSLLRGRYEGEVLRAADELFDTGSGWADVLERTDNDFGVWGIAYLEAVLRSADCQVSMEGS